MNIRLILVVTFAFLFHLQAPAASILDPTFNPGSGANGIVEQVLPMADGRILICGNFTSFNGANHAYIARLNSNGSLDESFNGQAAYWVRHMSLQADGKIIIGGFFKGVQGVERGLIARLNSDGSLDSSFNPGGTGCTDSLGVAIDGNADPFVFWTEIQSDGRIIATGNFRNYNGASSVGIVRINPDGSRDTTFNVGPGLDSWGRHIELLPNGQILLSGWFNNYNNRGFNRLARINPDGSPDGSFNAFFGDRTAIYSTVRLPDGKYVVAGHSLNFEGLFLREMERLNADGSVDSAFVGYTNEKTEAIALQPDGRIIIGGYFNAVNGVTRTSVARLFPNGSLDDSFQANIDNYVWSTVLDKDGKLMIGGGFYTVDGVSRNGIARLLTGASAGTPPVSPVLAVAASSPTQISLTWSDAATDRTGYVLERKIGANGIWNTVTSFGAAQRSYADGGLSFATAYYYRLRGNTTSGSTAFSNEASATTGGSGGGAGTATFLTADTTTGGSWKGVYGSEGYNIAADTGAYPGYVNVSLTGKADWIWAYSTTDARALQKVSSATDRLAAGWYSSGAITFDLNFTDGGAHKVSLYLIDWDGSGRVENVRIVDGTGAVLNTRTVSAFSGGVYLTWELSGHVQLQITPTSGNAVVSGIFFGGAGAAQPSVATPVISPGAGRYARAPLVTITCPTADAEIRYTLNGTEPTVTSAIYTRGLGLRVSCTVKARAFKSGMIPSATAANKYAVGKLP